MNYYKANETKLEDKIDIVFNGVIVTDAVIEANVDEGYIVIMLLVGENHKAKIIPNKPLTQGGWQPLTMRLEGRVEIVPKDNLKAYQHYLRGEAVPIPLRVDPVAETVIIYDMEFDWEFFRDMADPNPAHLYQLEKHDGVVHFHKFNLTDCLDETQHGFIFVTGRGKDNGQWYDLSPVNQQTGEMATLEAGLEALNIVTGVDLLEAEMYRDMAHELKGRGAGEIADLIIGMVDLATRIKGKI